MRFYGTHKRVTIMRKTFSILLGLWFAIGIQAQRQSIIFETDMGNDVDDALAIDMLYKYARQGQIRLMAVMLNKEGEFPPRYIDLLNTWYGQRRIPIGLSNNSAKSIVAGANYTQVVCEKKNEKGKPKSVKWNFTKFLINRNGEVVARFAPTHKPETFIDRVKEELNK